MKVTKCSLSHVLSLGNVSIPTYKAGYRNWGFVGAIWSDIEIGSCSGSTVGVDDDNANVLNQRSSSKDFLR